MDRVSVDELDDVDTCVGQRLQPAPHHLQHVLVTDHQPAPRHLQHVLVSDQITSDVFDDYTFNAKASGVRSQGQCLWGGAVGLALW